MFSNQHFTALIGILTAITFFFLLACKSPAKKKDQYYHAAENGLNTLHSTGDSLVDVTIPDSVVSYLRGKTFRYKMSQLTFDDSLHLTLTHNGKIDFTAQSQVDDYLVNNERLISIIDSNKTETISYTISYQGCITDRSTYALFKPEN
jgi:hypothetical protein